VHGAGEVVTASPKPLTLEQANVLHVEYLLDFTSARV
jgi:hypothetical protein